MLTLDYIAGFIDGEGCFSAHSSQKGSPALTITNTNKEVLEEISVSIEAIIGVKPRDIVLSRKDFGYYKKCYRLHLGAPILRLLLPIIIPFLRVKRIEGELMAELLALIPSVRGVHNDGRGSITWMKRELIISKIKLAKL